MRLDPITLTKGQRTVVVFQVMSAVLTSIKKLILDSIELAWLLSRAARQPVKPDDHSEVVPLLPIPNRTVKRLCADDSADSRVKVGHRQANILKNARIATAIRAYFISDSNSSPTAEAPR